VAQYGFEELGGNIGVEKAIAALRERRMVPYGIVDAEADEPTKQQVIVDLFHQLALRAHGVERLQQRSPEQPLRRDRLAAGALIHPLELGIE
jgi:hypothetical protein